MFQMGGIGPMFGQWNHFGAYAPEKVPYAIERYTNEVKRLTRVLNHRLDEAPWLAGDEYSMADIITFPWLRTAADTGARFSERGSLDLAEYPSVKRWYDEIAARPAVQRGLAVLSDQQRDRKIDDAERENTFGGDRGPRSAADKCLDDDVPDGRSADVRPVEPFRRLRPGKGALRDRALHERGEAADPRPEPSPRRGAVARRRRIQHGRHHHLPVDSHRRRAGARFAERGSLDLAEYPCGQALVRRDRGAPGGAARSRGAGPTSSATARSTIPSARTRSARRNSRRGDPSALPVVIPARPGSSPAIGG